MSKCKYRHEEYCAYIDQYCVEGPCPYEEPQTNADRIRAMSDEELATLLRSHTCPHPCEHEEDDYPCHICWLDWLKQEATE